MLRLILKPYLIVACLALLGGSFTFGWFKGSAHARAKFEEARLELQQDAFDLADEISEKNQEILELHRQQEELAHALEQEALAAEGSSAPGIAATGGCSVWNADGVRIEDLPQNVSESCPHPLEVIRDVQGTSVASDEIRMGRLGDALIECGQEKELAVEGYEELSDLLE